MEEEEHVYGKEQEQAAVGFHLCLKAAGLPALSPAGLKEPVCFHVIQIASFYNHSWKRNLVSGCLGDLQTHTLGRNSSTIIFLWPWSMGNFSNEEWKELETLFRVRLLEGIHRYSRELQFELKPEAWLSRGLSPGPGHLQLVCHVSGFYPKPVWVMWMRGEQEQQGTQRGDILPNADRTWYLRATLEVATGEAAGLSCRVKHGSLEGQDIILYWGEKELGPRLEMPRGGPQA
ncbi:hypothetical protein H8959_018657 [Pygathrix nigripes]